LTDGLVPGVFGAVKLLFALILAFATATRSAEEADLLKTVARGISKADQTSLAALQDLHSDKAAKLVLEAISSNRVSGGIKARLTEITAGWPATAPGRTFLAAWAAGLTKCDDDELLFLAGIAVREARGLFWREIEQGNGAPQKIRHPHRIAMAAKGLGQFEDNPEEVVTRIASLLDADYPHVIRACAADALGGMRHARAVEGLVPQVEDAAIGPLAVRSLYRLTGQHYELEPARQWQAWLAAQGAKIEFKMHSLADFENFLKIQALLKPANDMPVNMDTFYGIDVRGKGLLFILDVSGSMTIGDRIHTLRTQMGNILIALESRPEKTRYGILTFGMDVESCFPRGIMTNTLESRKRAGRFVENLRADGGTPMVEVLTHALTRVLPDANLDTIFFLSDGQPGDGTPEMVLEITRQIHERHRVRFNTISIGEATPEVFGDQSLLQQMAAITGGVFTRSE
jgi:uncharacterized protein YegL